MEKNGSVKWYQLVGSSLTILTIFVTISIFTANAMIVNDRMRASEDLRLSEEIKCLYEKVIATTEKNNIAHMEILSDLRIIKTRLAIPR